MEDSCLFLDKLEIHRVGVEVCECGCRDSPQYAYTFISQSRNRKCGVAIKKGKKLLQASQCYLYTTTCAGLLFVSTQRVAFCSNRPIKILIKFQYKVSIPLKKI